jgi:hypothetical protein
MSARTRGRIRTLCANTHQGQWPYINDVTIRANIITLCRVEWLLYEIFRIHRRGYGVCCFSHIGRIIWVHTNRYLIFNPITFRGKTWNLLTEQSLLGSRTVHRTSDYSAGPCGTKGQGPHLEAFYKTDRAGYSQRPISCAVPAHSSYLSRTVHCLSRQDGVKVQAPLQNTRYSEVI